MSSLDWEKKGSYFEQEQFKRRRIITSLSYKNHEHLHSFCRLAFYSAQIAGFNYFKDPKFIFASCVRCCVVLCCGSELIRVFFFCFFFFYIIIIRVQLHSGFKIWISLFVLKTLYYSLAALVRKISFGPFGKEHSRGVFKPPRTF